MAGSPATEEFDDLGVAGDGQDYYYLISAVDTVGHESNTAASLDQITATGALDVTAAGKVTLADAVSAKSVNIESTTADLGITVMAYSSTAGSPSSSKATSPSPPVISGGFVTNAFAIMKD